MSLQPITKIIFDNDGVNIDSETVAMQVMDDFGYDLVARYIAEPEQADPALKRGDVYKEFPGTSTNKIVEALIKRYSLPVEQIVADFGLGEDSGDVETVANVLADIVTHATNEAFKKELKAIPGIAGALREIDNLLGGIENRALCTTSPEERMNISLAYAADPATGENAGLAELFPDEGNRRISGYGHDNKYEFFRSLHPDLDPAQTAIVEDSLSGVKKAKAASPEFRVIGTVASEFYQDKPAQVRALLQAGATVVVHDVRDIPAAIEWMNEGLDMDSEIPLKFKGAVHHGNFDPSGGRGLADEMAFRHG